MMIKKEILHRVGNGDEITALDDLHPVLRRVYLSRQITSHEDLERNLEHLLPYQALLGMDKAVALLVDAVRQQKRILIVGDFDADGATSTAVAVRSLRSFGAKHVQYLVPNRFEYGYGLTPELVLDAKKLTPEVIVTVDNGIANHAGVDAAKALGIQVIITDHHLPSVTLPKADAIVNPNQPDDLFPSKCLAGVGVVFYVMLALRRQLLAEGWFAHANLPEPVMSKLLDIVALGTVADLVPLDRNNRILVHQGLRRIRAGQCVPGLIALLEQGNRDFSRVTASDLGFAVGARLNAAGRLDDMSLGIECLLSDDSIQAREIAKRLDQLNAERRYIEQGMQSQAHTALAKLSEQLAGELPKGLCLYDEGWHQGVIGILASRIKDRYHRPVIVFAPGQALELKGSARSIPNLHIRDVLADIDATHPGLIMKFGGHAMAAGLTIQNKNLKEFSKVFDEVVSARVTEADLQHTILSDGELAAADLSLEVATLLRDAGPFGQGFPEPLFDGTFRVLEQRIVGDKHLKLRLASGDKVIDGIAFFVDTQAWPNHRCETIRVAYKLDVSEYKGRCSPQLIVEYLEEGA